MAGLTYRTEHFEGTPEEFTTTFTGDFDIAEVFGIDAVKDTFERSFVAWKDDIKYLTNLGMVMNYKAWEAFSKQKNELAELYSQLWFEIYDFVWADDSPVSEDDRAYFFRVTD